MGVICSNSQIKRKESKQIQTDKIVEIINNNSYNYNNLNIVIELIYDISIFDMAIYQQMILICSRNKKYKWQNRLRYN
ncbi:unnamed protein product [Paramecium sonneborni]|uniref:Uncharacterized protein n=1 Tax=Paramecium sonneborni TaxID=65129 RepID=A0A8S1QKZ4_9CILI|nr:unnamed protein product [Paramecium sonneborni]